MKFIESKYFLFFVMLQHKLVVKRKKHSITNIVTNVGRQTLSRSSIDGHNLVKSSSSYEESTEKKKSPEGKKKRRNEDT